MRNQAQYWDTILDPRNLSDKRDLLTQFELETERAFYQTPAQQYAYQLMGEVQGKKILELGGGLGVNAVILACAGAKVTVIDISEKRVEWMQRLVAQTQLQSQVQVIRMSAEELAFPANRFDIVYTNAVLIHVDKQKTAREVRRVLTPGGKAIFVEPLKYHPLVNLYRFTVAPKIWREIAQYFSFQDIETLGKLFREYTHREFYLVSFFAFYWEFGKRNLPRFQKSLARWQKVDSQILQIFPFLNKLCWFTVFCGTK